LFASLPQGNNQTTAKQGLQLISANLSFSQASAPQQKIFFA
jgi:hypothetical protein